MSEKRPVTRDEWETFVRESHPGAFFGPNGGAKFRRVVDECMVKAAEHQAKEERRSANGGPCSACNAWREFDPWPGCTICRKPLCPGCAKDIPTPANGTALTSRWYHVCPACVAAEKAKAENCADCERVECAKHTKKPPPKPRATCTVTVRKLVPANYYELMAAGAFGAVNGYWHDRPCGAPAVESGPWGAWCQAHFNPEVVTASKPGVHMDVSSWSSSTLYLADLTNPVTLMKTGGSLYAAECGAWVAPGRYCNTRVSTPGAMCEACFKKYDALEPGERPRPEGSEPGPLARECLNEAAGARELAADLHDRIAHLLEAGAAGHRDVARFFARQPKAKAPKPGRIARARAWLNGPGRERAFSVTCLVGGGATGFILDALIPGWNPLTRLLLP